MSTRTHKYGRQAQGGEDDDDDDDGGDASAYAAFQSKLKNNFKKSFSDNFQFS
jgi:hypothetical protein